MARNQDSWATYTLLIVAIVSLLLALTPVMAHADLLDPETGEYNGPVWKPDPELEIDPEVAPEPEPEPEPVDEPVDQDGLPLFSLGLGAVVLAVGATATIVHLNKRPAV